MRTVSVVVPVYNNAETLFELHRRLVEHLDGLSPKVDHEIVFVNDGSTDGSLVALRELRVKDARVALVDLSRNFGQVPAILAGWDHSNGDAVVNIAADLQDPVDQIGRMVAEWEKGSDIVVSYREERRDNVFSRLASAAAYSLWRWSLPQLPPGGFDTALLSRKALDAVRSLQERNRFFQGDILWVGFDVKFIPQARLPRLAGESGYTFAKKMRYFLKSYLSISYLPIRFMSLVGFLTALAGFIYTVVVLHAYLHGKPPFGWTPIMLVILFLGGLIMIMLGIIGEYVWRIYDETKRKPLYIIKDLQR
ncbi:MAG: glycosyltransferase family 2 protein [Elusimicrobia bacterium]|nr:glycosyltransferase family 2 protein [Elusimicrobiota bacterium]